MHQTGRKIRTVIADRPKKRVIRFDNPTIHLPRENPHYVGVDQAPYLCLAFCEITIDPRKCKRALLLRLEQTCVFDRDHRLVSEVLEQRDLPGGEWSDFPSSHQNDTNWDALAQQGRGKRRPVALTFCIAAAGGKFAVLRGEITDLNRPTIADRSANHPLAICGNALTSLDIHRDFPV